MRRIFSTLGAVIMIFTMIFSANCFLPETVKAADETENILVAELVEDSSKYVFQQGDNTVFQSNFGISSLISSSDGSIKFYFLDGTSAVLTDENCPALKYVNDRKANDEVERFHAVVCDNDKHLISLVYSPPGVLQPDGSYEIEAYRALVNPDGSYYQGYDGFMVAEDSINRDGPGTMSYIYGNVNKYTLNGVEYDSMFYDDRIALVTLDMDTSECCIVDRKSGEILIDNIKTFVYRFAGVKVDDNIKMMYVVDADGNLYKLSYKKVSSGTSDYTINHEGTTVKTDVVIEAGGEEVKVSASVSENTVPADSSFSFTVLQASDAAITDAKKLVSKFIADESKDTTAVLDDKAVLWNIDLLSFDGQKLQPNNGKVTITVPLPQGLDKENVAVYRINDNQVKRLSAKVVGTSVVFETDHFSYFVIGNAPVEKQNDPTEPPTTESVTTEPATTESETTEPESTEEDTTAEDSTEKETTEEDSSEEEDNDSATMESDKTEADTIADEVSSEASGDDVSRMKPLVIAIVAVSAVVIVGGVVLVMVKKKRNNK